MGIFKKDDKPVEEFSTVDEAVAAHDEQEVVEAPVQAHEAEELDSVEQRNKENNEALGGSDGFFVAEPQSCCCSCGVQQQLATDRKKKESVAQYNARVPIGVQPVAEGPKLSYLGKPL